MRITNIAVLILTISMLAGVSQATEKKVLVYTKFGKGFVHTCVQACADAVAKLGKENGFGVDVSNDPSRFTDENLKQYAALVFDNTNNELFDTEDQKAALQKYLKAGGGFVGIHSTSGGMRNWDWYAQLIGAKFKMHPPSQPLTVRVTDTNHPSTCFLPNPWQWQKDECYFHKDYVKDLRILLCVDVNTLKASKGKDGKEQDLEATAGGKSVPVTWCREFDGGRMWFTALGHEPAHYSDPVFAKHILGGIQWAMGESKSTVTDGAKK